MASSSGSTAAALLPVLAPAIGSLLGGGSSGGSSSRPGAPSRPSSGGGGASDILKMALPFVGPALGLPSFGGSSSSRPSSSSSFGGPPKRADREPPSPYRGRPPAPTAQPRIRTTTPIPRKPDCPGTCIGSVLSFTCFSESVCSIHDSVCRRLCRTQTPPDTFDV